MMGFGGMMGFPGMDESGCTTLRGCEDAERNIEAGDCHVVGLLQISVLPPLRLEPTEEWHRIAIRLTGIGLNRSTINSPVIRNFNSGHYEFKPGR
jgi:hypothetical protein